MILNLDINLLKNPNDGDTITFDLKNNGISSFGSGKTITFKSNTLTAATQTHIENTLSGTVHTLLGILSGYNTATTDSSRVTYTSTTPTNISITYDTSTASISGYTSVSYSSSPDDGLTFDFDSYIPSSATTSGLIGVTSPYFIFYNEPLHYDLVKVDLRIWKGNLVLDTLGGDKPSIPSYQFTKYKTKYTDTTVALNVNNFVKSFLNPKLNSFWGSGATLNNVFDEVTWVEWVAYGGVDIVDVDGNSTGDIELVSITSDRKLATLGYGYFEDGANPTFGPVLTTQPLYNTLGNPEYLVTGNTATTHTDYAIVRTKYADRGTCEGLNTTYQVVYLNKAGVFEGFSFPKLSKRTMNSKSTSYNRLLATPYAYSTIDHTARVLNKTEKITYTLNTDLLKEADVTKIKELIQSDRHYLVTDSAIIPVIYKDSDFEYKNMVNNKARIQYTLQFDSANDVKNNII